MTYSDPDPDLQLLGFAGQSALINPQRGFSAQAQDDAAFGGVRSSRYAGSRATGDDRHVMGGAAANHVLDVLYGFCPHNGQWKVSLHCGPLVD